MSSQASKAELHRLLSGEKDLERNSGFEKLAPRSVIENADFDHVGAVFGPRKDSCPVYPDCVDLHDNEATMQPDPAQPCSRYNRQLQSTPERILPHSPPTPTLTPTQKGPFMSPTEYNAFEHQRLAQAREEKSFRSRGTHESTPAQSRDHSPTTTTGYDDQSDSRLPHGDAMSEEHLDRATPSHCSFASDETNNHREGVAPFPPQPFTAYNLYKIPENTNDSWEAGYTWPRNPSH
ncbi:hypothetical protein E8E12_002092 [Didymella heteroderae]|uniref:Uncharacterized protein n=1 Tax=Didymella heteroderae TaxID=1769908 RepID=A0A9P4WHZ9_9PLEO|nr:hypothetical protein E8E12_002092 [Didymella heteroderae]